MQGVVFEIKGHTCTVYGVEPEIAVGEKRGARQYGQRQAGTGKGAE